ncbi:hypothetical protein KBB89_01500 [Candidatus Gracilibacteria bacterium]|nr:hypothetical protein [Candidatus Gracilibacteria bacterium]
MSFLPNLDRDWREKEPDDIWFEVYLNASGPHRKLIHHEMASHKLTVREATQKIFKCNQGCAERDVIPPRWDTTIIRQESERKIVRILGSQVFQELINATSADPALFDSEIIENRG